MKHYKRRFKMCVIAVCNTRSMTEKEMRDAFEMNNDGAGFAWSTTDGLTNYLKGFMTADDIVSAYKSANMRRTLPHVVHFRNATSKVCPELTHPYIVNNESPNITEYHGNEPLLFHNGVLSSWRSTMLEFYMNNRLRVPDGDFSDTRFMAILISYMGKNALSMLNAGKFVFITNDMIDLIGDFINDRGILFSNLSYKKVYADRGGRHTNASGGNGPLSVRYSPSSRYNDSDLEAEENGAEDYIDI